METVAQTYHKCVAKMEKEINDYLDELYGRNKIMLNDKSDKIKIKGHRGTWYVVDTKEYDGVKYFLLESEQYGDESNGLIVLEDGTIKHDEVYNGWLDLEEQMERAE